MENAILNFDESSDIFGQTNKAITVFPVHYTLSYYDGYFMADCWDKRFLAGSGPRETFEEALGWAEDHFEGLLNEFWPMAVEQ